MPPKLVTSLEGLAGKIATIGGIGGGLPAGGLSGQGLAVAGGAMLGTFDTKQDGSVTGAQMGMMQAYVAKGYSPAAAAGFVGGTTTESGINLDPMAKNASGHIGIAQWDASRWGQVSNFAGGAAWTREGQTAASLAELSTTERRAGGMLADRTAFSAACLRVMPMSGPAMRRRGLALTRGNNLFAAFQGEEPPLSIGVNGGVQPMLPVASTAEASASQARADTMAGVQNQFTSPDASLFGTPLGDASHGLANQVAMLDTQRDTFGQTAAASKGAAEAQQIWNKYVSEGVAPAGELSKQTGGLADSVRAYGAQATAVAQRSQDQDDRQKSFIGTEDSIRSFTSNSADTLFSGLAQHNPASSLFRSIGLNLGQSLIHSGVGRITDGLFGKSGQAGGGLFGGGISSILSDLFGGGGLSDLGQGGIGHNAAGTNDWRGGLSVVGEKGPELVNMPAHAQVIPNSALSAMRPASGHTINVGGPTINIAGDVSEQDDRLRAIAFADALTARTSDVITTVGAITCPVGPAN